MMPAIECRSPVDGSIVAARDGIKIQAAETIIARAKQAQAAWALRPLAERVAAVKAGIEALGAMNDEVVPELAWMMGRPVRYGGEFGGVAERGHHMAAIAAQALAPAIIEESDQFERRITREPHGLVFVIAPWNYPYLTAINAVAPALIAGNAVILKPARQTLLAGERLVAAMVEGGVPPEICQCLHMSHATAEALIAANHFGFVNFTGSVAAGRAIERAAAGTFTGLGLELGGKDPGYVLADADVAAAADGLIDGAMFNSGQCCCGIERIYVAERHFDAFVERAVAIVEGYQLGNPLEPATSIGPMAQPRLAALVRQQTQQAVAKGAKALIDPKLFPADDGAGYLAPQILINVDHTMDVMREESFGPVVGIMKVSSDAEAITLMNDSPYGLTASLWTQDPSRAAAIGAAIDTGTVFMNRCDYLDPAICWTGCKDTGRGVSLSEFGYHSLTRPKSYHLKKA